MGVGMYSYMSPSPFLFKKIRYYPYLYPCLTKARIIRQSLGVDGTVHANTSLFVMSSQPNGLEGLS